MKVYIVISPWNGSQLRCESFEKWNDAMAEILRRRADNQRAAMIEVDHNVVFPATEISEPVPVRVVEKG